MRKSSYEYVMWHTFTFYMYKYSWKLIQYISSVYIVSFINWMEMIGSDSDGIGLFEGFIIFLTLSVRKCVHEPIKTIRSSSSKHSASIISFLFNHTIGRDNNTNEQCQQYEFRMICLASDRCGVRIWNAYQVTAFVLSQIQKVNLEHQFERICSMGTQCCVYFVKQKNAFGMFN